MWIESHSDVWTHFKTRRLQKTLNVPLVQAVGHLLSLWHFTLDNAWQTGNLERWGDDGIEEACRWAGDPGVLVAAMRDAGYIDDFQVHDWFDYAGELVRKRRTREMRKVEQAGAVLDGAGPDFESFYTLYPRQVRRVEAAKAWIELNPDPTLVKKILEAVESHKKSLDWQRDAGSWIPFPNTWLNNRRWEERYRAAPPPPTAPAPKCSSCFAVPRAPNSLYCDKCGWCSQCDDGTGVQNFEGHEMVKGPDGRAACPLHAGKWVAKA